MTDITPATLPNSFEEIEKVAKASRGLVRRVQVDITDGIYTPTKTWPYVGDGGEFEALKTQERGLPLWEDMEYELDMMVSNPEEVFEDWILAGMNALIFHIESIKEEVNLSSIITRAKEMGVEVGVALRPSTPNSALEEYYKEIDFVQCMGSDRIGEHGVTLDEGVYKKIEDIRVLFPGTIAVDIGVNRETAPKLVAAGANKLAAYSALFNAPNLKEEITYYQQLS